MQNLNIKPSDLPQSARIIAEVIGVEATLALAQQFGNSAKGGRVYVPTPGHLTYTHPIVLLLGFPTSTRLAAHFGGEKIYVPFCRRAVRHARIWKDFMAGMSVRDIAAKHQVKKRVVYWLTAEEGGGFRPDHFRTIGRMSSPQKTAAARRYGTLGGKNNFMIRKILSSFLARPETPYGSVFASLRAFSPKLTLLLDHERADEISAERVVELMAACLPAEITIEHGSRATLMTLKPSKQAKTMDPLMVRVETAVTAKAPSQNSLVIAMLEALAVSAVVDKMDEFSGRPKVEDAKN